MPWPTPIGNLDETAIRDLANTVKLRAIANRAANVYVFADSERDVFAVPSGQGEAMFDHRSTECRIGVYSRKAAFGAIVEDLICARDEAMASRRPG
jgi:hypothetical protein